MSQPDESLVAPTELTAQVTEGRFKRVLGVPSLVLFGLVYMVPLTAFTTYGIVTQLTGGRVAATYIITLVAMVFTARSYARMSVAYPYSGSAYVYTQQSFGGALGFLAGWALLLDYLFLPMINYLIIGLYMGASFPGVPTWIWIVAAIAVVTVLNVVGIVSVARANFVVIAVQAVFVIAFVALSIGAASGQGVDPLVPFTGDGTVGSILPLFQGAAILCLSFLGFDSVSTLAEEAKDSRRTVPRAIMIVTIGAGLLFILLTYLAQIAYPSNAFESADTASIEVVASFGLPWVSTLFIAGFIAGSIGSALTSQASVARILFAMGRDGVLPRAVFGRLSKRFGTPVVPILIVSAVSLYALFADLLTMSNMISFGALIAFSCVNLSTIKHYFVDRGERSGWDAVNNLVLPGIGFALTIWLWTNLSGMTFVVGLSWLAVGFVLLLIVTRFFRRPTPTLDLKE
ncbi:Putrescine importer PuuP [Microbacterium hydrocarbonoxydans]|uniref:Putrescine importer PuuP n=1 Tax=Microbacterium hydrocarbonoxydans TaxID=273678 RepID=A0A0M2HTW7_9MICO|nr:APC family permease [Microbacterium hydrocarbonoxydans]KJL48360.1 Putrescine importer PuuP [Microbacterium hydrocarbonoxydans]